MRSPMLRMRFVHPRMPDTLFFRTCSSIPLRQSGWAGEDLTCTVIVPFITLYWIEGSDPEVDEDCFGQERRFTHLVPSSKVSCFTAIKSQKGDSSRHSPLNGG